MRISPSKIMAFDCGHYFWNQYLAEKAGRDEEGPETPLNLLTGRFSHAVVDLYTRMLKERGLAADFALFNDIFDEMWRRVQYMPNSLHDEVKDSMVGFAETFCVDPQTLWASEKEIALTLDMEETAWDAEDAWLRVKLDRIDIYPGDSTALITDYKTQRFIPSEAKLKKSLQSIIYPFALWKLNPFLERFIMCFHYIRWNMKVQLEYRPDDFQGIEKRLKDLTARMQQKVDDPRAVWQAIRCDNCGICRYDCPLTGMSVEPIRDPDKAASVAQQIEALRDKQKRLRDDLMAYCKASDETIETHEGIYGYRPITILRGIKAMDVVQVMMDQGLDGNKLVKFDSDAFKKFPDCEAKEMVGALGKKSIQSRFAVLPKGQEPHFQPSEDL